MVIVVSSGGTAVSEQDAHVLGEDHGLVEQDLPPGDLERRSRASNRVFALSGPKVDLGVQPIPVQQEVRSDRMLAVGGSGTDPNVCHEMTRSARWVLCPVHA